MKIIFVVLFLLYLKSAESGTPCPSSKDTFPCTCINFEDGFSLVVCPSIQNASQLEQVTRSLKSMIVDRMILVDTFPNNTDMEEMYNAVDPSSKKPLHGMLPKKWLSELRVRDLEILNSNLHGYFLADETLDGQTGFLTSIVVKNSKLRGHICSSCGPAAGLIALLTGELRKAPFLKVVDLSYNELEFVDGSAFPAQLKELKKIVLANNQILIIQDNAFSNLHNLKYLDVSRNRIKSISRKIFRNPDNSLTTLDFSYNSIQTLPDDLFQGLNVLKEIKLNNNLLEVMHSNTWSRLPTSLERIEVKGNFLVCNCTMKWINRTLHKSARIVAYCVGPKQAEFQELRPNMPSINQNCP